MLKLIGLRRTIVISTLLAINVIIAFVYLVFVMPMLGQAERSLAGVNSTISALQGDILNIKGDLQEFQEKLPAYRALEKDGFIAEQDRFAMARDLEKIRDLSGLKGFAYEIDDVRDLGHEALAEAKMRLIASRIRFSRFETVYDIPVYKLIGLMQSAFPSQVRVYKFSLRQLAKIDQTRLENIAKGNDPGLFSAEVELDWITMTPLPDPAPENLPGNVTGGYR